jgi:osmotically-inducible protein OsmY
MRKAHITIAGLLALEAGCYHNQTDSTTAHAEARLEDAMAAAQRGSLGPWHVQGLYVESLGAGAVRVTHGQKWDSRIPVRGLSNDWITTKVKSKFAADPNVQSLSVHVSTDENGLVTLKGDVPSAAMAARAVEDALDVEGVNAVDSYLTWQRR